MPKLPLDCCCRLLSEPISEEEAENLAALCKVLADPVRLRIVSLIATSADGEVCACDLPGVLGKSQPTISHHLGVLTDAGILEREQRGRWAWFHLVPTRLDQISSSLASA